MPHIHEQIDFTAEVYIVHNNKVLLRLHDKYNFWLGVGGHIELDEDPNSAAIREAKEEVGLKIQLYTGNMRFTKDEENYKELIPPQHMNIHKISDTHRHIALVFYASSETNNVTPENATDTWQWLSKEEIEKRDDIKSDVKFYAMSALEAYTAE